MRSLEWLPRLRVALRALGLLALSSGCAAQASPAKTPPTAASQLASLPDPERLWIRDAWSGLGPSYELLARLQRVGETYEAECTLQVHPMTPTTESLPPRAEVRSVVVPARAVHAFLDAARHATPQPEGAGLIYLPGIDDSGEAEILLFYRDRSGPIYLKAGAISTFAPQSQRFTVGLDQRYRLNDEGEAYRAYRALMDAMGLYPWVEAVNRTAAPDGESP